MMKIKGKRQKNNKGEEKKTDFMRASARRVRHPHEQKIRVEQ